MISFGANGEAIVSWEVPSNGGRSRDTVGMSLSDYLALVKVSTTLEELRVLVLTQVDREREPHKKAQKEREPIASAAGEG